VEFSGFTAFAFHGLDGGVDAVLHGPAASVDGGREQTTSVSDACLVQSAVVLHVVQTSQQLPDRLSATSLVLLQQPHLVLVPFLALRRLLHRHRGPQTPPVTSTCGLWLGIAVVSFVA